ASRQPQLVLGARGVMGLELTAYGPARALHSGHYGNWAPNPALGLARLLASLRDDDGRILVAGFYDDVRPVSDAEHRALAALPAVDRELRAELLLGATEGGGARRVGRAAGASGPGRADARRQPAALGLRRRAQGAPDHGPDRQPRRRPARARREPAPAEPLGRDRALRRHHDARRRPLAALAAGGD